MHIIGSIVLACQSQKQLMLWAFMPFLTKNGWFFGYFFLERPWRVFFNDFPSSLIITQFSFTPIYLS